MTTAQRQRVTRTTTTDQKKKGRRRGTVREALMVKDRGDSLHTHAHTHTNTVGLQSD